VPENLFLLQGKIEGIHNTRQGSIDWHDNKMLVIKRIAVNEYAATIDLFHKLKNDQQAAGFYAIINA
jgi:hypothetical protein